MGANCPGLGASLREGVSSAPVNGQALLEHAGKKGEGEEGTKGPPDGEKLPEVLRAVRSWVLGRLQTGLPSGRQQTTDS